MKEATEASSSRWRMGAEPARLYAEDALDAAVVETTCYPIIDYCTVRVLACCPLSASCKCVNTGPMVAG